MPHTISFPALGWSVTVDPVAFRIGNWPVYWYGILIACGFLLAILYAGWRTRQSIVRYDDLMDVLLFGTPAAIAGARLYYCVFHFSEFAKNPASIVRIWDGGLAIYGGLIAALITVVIFCRVRKISAPALADLVALGFLIGQIIGRWGNFCNAECFGRDIAAAADGSYPFYAMMLSNHPGAAVHPLFFYESGLNFLLFLALHFYFRHRKFDGEIFLCYLSGYGVIRFLTEGIRNAEDALKIWGTDLRVSQLLALLCAVTGITLLVILRIRKRKVLPENGEGEN